MEELEKAGRAGRPLALLMADLDLLRNINNTCGHQAGDAVLAGVGQTIREVIHDYGIPGRFGGEEFAIALPETGLPEALAIAERLRRAVEEANFVVPTSRTPIRATVTIGVSCFPEDGTAADVLIHQADVALYQAKLGGRNRVVCAADVPHFVKLDSESVELPATTPYAAAFAHLVETPTEPPSAAQSPAPADKAGEPAGAAVAPPVYPAGLAGWFIGGTALIGLAVVIAGLAFAPRPDFLALGLLVGLAVVAELFQIKVYQYSLLLLVPMSVAALLYYALDTGLIAAAISLSSGTSLATTWREQFRWLIEHYLVLCIMGLFLAVAYAALGPLDLLVFALPVFMMRYTQKQYVSQNR